MDCPLTGKQCLTAATHIASPYCSCKLTLIRTAVPDCRLPLGPKPARPGRHGRAAGRGRPAGSGPARGANAALPPRPPNHLFHRLSPRPPNHLFSPHFPSTFHRLSSTVHCPFTAYPSTSPLPFHRLTLTSPLPFHRPSPRPPHRPPPPPCRLRSTATRSTATGWSSSRQAKHLPAVNSLCPSP